MGEASGAHHVAPYLGRVTTDSGEVVGTAFQVAQGFLVTAWHVLRDAGSPDKDDEVKVCRFGSDDDLGGVVWRVDPELDVATIRVQYPLAASVEKLVASSGVEMGAALEIQGAAQIDDFGYDRPDVQTVGMWQGSTTQGSIVVGRFTADAVVPRMSGAPVRLLGTGAVVGVVTQRYESVGTTLANTAWATLCEDTSGVLAGTDVTLESEVGSGSAGVWGAALAEGDVGLTHWRPRARGVTSDSEAGYRFRGRRRALEEIVDWMASPAVAPLVVTGSPGVGKSAVLARIVTTSDPVMRAELPATDAAVRAPLGSVAVAVHAKGKTSLEVAQHIADAAGVGILNDRASLGARLSAGLGERSSGFTIIIDAVDEASSTRDMVDIAATARDLSENLRAKVLVGSRRRHASRDLLKTFGQKAGVIDLDRDEYFEFVDIMEYSAASLALDGNERANNPYEDQSVRSVAAEALAHAAQRNFLVAGLVGRAHGLYDIAPFDPNELDLGRGLEDAIELYLEQIRDHSGVTEPDTLLAALAYSYGAGFTDNLWVEAARALGVTSCTSEVIAHFRRSPAANFLIEDCGSSEGSQYRLFHRALVDALRRRRHDHIADNDAETVYRHFHSLAESVGWAGAPSYLCRHLVNHAAEAGALDELLVDPGFLVASDPITLAPLLRTAQSDLARKNASVYGLALPKMPHSLPALRASMLQLTARTQGHDELADQLFAQDEFEAPFRVPMAARTPAMEQLRFTGHTRPVGSMCAFNLDGITLLATGSDDKTVRAWDPATGQAHGEPFTGHTLPVLSVCAFTLDGTTLLATGSGDRTVRVWDPTTGQAYGDPLTGHSDSVSSVCAFTLDGTTLLASASWDRTVRIWDPATGEAVGDPLGGHTNWVFSVCAFTLDGITLLASASWDRTVRIWDPATGLAFGEPLTGHNSKVNLVCAFTLDGTTLLASASDDETVRIWDPATGQSHLHPFSGLADLANVVCAVNLDATTLLAASSDNNTVRVWDPATGEEFGSPLTGHTETVGSVCGFALGGTTLLATASGDWTVRIWDPATGRDFANPQLGRARSVCAFTLDGTSLLAFAGDDETVRIWDPATGLAFGEPLTGHNGIVYSVCAVTLDGKTLLVTVSGDETVRIWDPATGLAFGEPLTGHSDMVQEVCAFMMDGTPWLATASGHTLRIWDPATRQSSSFHLPCGFLRVASMCSLTLDGTSLLAFAGDDETVRIWDPATGVAVGEPLTGHNSIVYAMCSFILDGTPLLASASGDTLRIWDPATGQAYGEPLTGHTDTVQAVCALTIDGTTLLASGGYDNMVRIWDPATGQRYGNPIDVGARIYGIASTIDGLLGLALDDGVLAVQCHSRKFRK